MFYHIFCAKFVEIWERKKFFRQKFIRRFFYLGKICHAFAAVTYNTVRAVKKAHRKIRCAPDKGDDFFLKEEVFHAEISILLQYE